MGDEMTRESELERRIEALERRSTWSDLRSRGPSTFETAFWAVMHRLFPDDARHHMRAATREQLLAARTYLDRWIARLEEDGSKKTDATDAPDAERRVAEKIEIE